MKKIIIALFICTLIYLNQEEKIIIPQESIRFRIIAENNTNQSQMEKMLILSDIYPYLLKASTIDIIETRDNLINIEEEISPLIKNYTDNFKVNYGINYFPEKNYHGVIYESGNYESLVIELGESEGDNWWCVLFPPLCLMEEEESEIEYQSFVKEVINKTTK